MSPSANTTFPLSFSAVTSGASTVPRRSRGPNTSADDINSNTNSGGNSSHTEHASTMNNSNIDTNSYTSPSTTTLSYASAITNGVSYNQSIQNNNNVNNGTTNTNSNVNSNLNHHAANTGASGLTGIHHLTPEPLVTQNSSIFFANLSPEKDSELNTSNGNGMLINPMNHNNGDNTSGNPNLMFLSSSDPIHQPIPITQSVSLSNHSSIDFEFDSVGPFQQRSIDFGSFMSGLLVSPLISPSPNLTQQSSASSMLDFGSNPNGHSSSQNGSNMALPSNNGERLSNGSSNIGSMAGPVGSRRRGPSVTSTTSNMLSVEVPSSLDNAFGPGSPTGTNMVGLSGLSSGISLSGPGSLSMNPLPNNGLLFPSSDPNITDLSEQRLIQLNSSNKLLQTQVLALQNDLISKTRDYDIQNQRLMEVMHLLQQSEERCHNMSVEKENTLAQWRLKSSEFSDYENKLRVRNEEISNLKEMLKDREATLARSELTKNSLIPELKQLRSRISQMEGEIEDARKKATEFDRIKQNLSHEIDQLRSAMKGTTNQVPSKPPSPITVSNSNGSFSGSNVIKDSKLIISNEPVLLSQQPALSVPTYDYKLSSTPPPPSASNPLTAALAWDNDRARIALQAEVDSLRAQLNDLRRSMGSFQEYFPVASASTLISTRTLVPPTSNPPATKTVTVSISGSASTASSFGDTHNYLDEGGYKPVIKCSLPGCEQDGLHICTGCNSVGYCGVEHQK
jgi:hypothetical protein